MKDDSNRGVYSSGEEIMKGDSRFLKLFVQCLRYKHISTYKIFLNNVCDVLVLQKNYE